MSDLEKKLEEIRLLYQDKIQLNIKINKLRKEISELQDIEDAKWKIDKYKN